MFPELRIFNLIIPMYPICVATGFLLGTVILYWDFSKLGEEVKYVFPLVCFVEVGVIIGGKMLFLLLYFRWLSRYFQKFGFWGIFTKTGFVFYGGLFGGMFAILVFAKKYKQEFLTLLVYVLSVTPIIHSFGRIGCFCSGCCYGIKYNRFLNVYMNNVRRFPVQLLEAGFLLLLFFLLQKLLLNNKKYVVAVYFLGYGIIRFVCEFFRGDKERGFIGVLSISAWISLLCITVGFMVLIKQLRNNIGNKTNELAIE